jgi:hypothetical protein
MIAMQSLTKRGLNAHCQQGVLAAPSASFIRARQSPRAAPDSPNQEGKAVPSHRRYRIHAASSVAPDAPNPEGPVLGDIEACGCRARILTPNIGGAK